MKAQSNLMEQKIHFYEKQKFNQWWIALFFVFINGLFLFGLYQQLFIGEPFGSKPTSDLFLLINFFLVISITVCFYLLKLETQINDDCIYVRFFPFHIKYKKYEWSTISKCYIRKYRPILEYGV